MTPRNISLIGLVVTLAASISYFVLLNFRPIAALHIAITILGMALCIWAVWQRRGWVTVGSLSISSIVGLGLILSLTLLMQLPPPALIAQTAETLPDFTLPNQEGAPIRPASYRGKGPVLLVFYRGHW